VKATITANEPNVQADNPIILVAEDVLMNMMLVKGLLKRLLSGAKIIEAENGQIAVKTALSQKVDLVLMDVQMPLMDGIEATKQIREWERLNGKKTCLPIVALTAGALKEEQQKAIDCGMDEFLTKPIEPEKLKACLTKYLYKTK